jgi:AcrR family transcriptional regulator
MATAPGRKRKSTARGDDHPSAAKAFPALGNEVRPSGTASGGRAGARAKRSAERRDAILAAALDEFSASGFASTRLDDVARRAGVAKGTIYLHFADKETLFQELIRMELSPVVAALEHVSHADIPLRQVTDKLVEVFVREIFGTRRKDVIRLVLTEGPRFPALAEFYFREVISRVMSTIRDMLRRAHQRGELKSDALVRFPQLLPAPGIVAIIWSGLFDRFEPIDVRAMMQAHFDILLGPRSKDHD